MNNNQDISNLPFEQLFEMGQQKYNQMDYQQAEYYYGLAFQKKSHDDMIVLCYANILKKNDKPNQAKKILTTSLKDNPAGTYRRYFQLAEIQAGYQSIKVFQKGIAAANKCLSNPFSSTIPQAQIKRDIARAYASIAEICMTDLTNVPFQQVQAKCAQVLQKGKQIDPSCMDIYLQIANCCIQKQQNQLAKNSLLIIKQAVLQQKQQYEDQLVTQCAKYFMQISQFQNSIQVLQKLNQTQNNNPQTVYLMAFCSFQMGKYNQCRQYIKQYPEGQMIDEQVEQAMKELKIQLAKKLKKQAQSTQEGNADNEDQEWMDMEDEDEEDIN